MAKSREQSLDCVGRWHSRSGQTLARSSVRQGHHCNRSFFGVAHNIGKNLIPKQLSSAAPYEHTSAHQKCHCKPISGSLSVDGRMMSWLQHYNMNSTSRPGPTCLLSSGLWTLVHSWNGNIFHRFLMAGLCFGKSSNWLLGSPGRFI